jgi:hypothetical protein
MNDTQKMLFEDIKRLKKQFPELTTADLIQIQRNEILFDGLFNLDKKLDEIKHEIRDSK